MAAWRQTCWLRSAVAECWPTPALNCMTDSQLAWMSNVVRQLWATCGTRAYGGLADGIGGVSGTCHSVRSVLLATA